MSLLPNVTYLQVTLLTDTVAYSLLTCKYRYLLTPLLTNSHSSLLPNFTYLQVALLTDTITY